MTGPIIRKGHRNRGRFAPRVRPVIAIGVRILSEGLRIRYMDYGLSLSRDKNRFVLPADFRKALIQSSGENLMYLDFHETLPCLIGFGASRIDELEAKFERDQRLAEERGQDFDEFEEYAKRLGGFVPVKFDDSGRFIMPANVKEGFAFGKSLFFYGAGRFFTIWNPLLLLEQGDAWAKAKMHCAAQMKSMKVDGL